MTERKRDFLLPPEGVGTKKSQGKGVRTFLANTWSRNSARKLEAMLKKEKKKKFCFVQQAEGVILVLRSQWLDDQSVSGKLIRWCYGLGCSVGRRDKSVRSHQ